MKNTIRNFTFNRLNPRFAYNGQFSLENLLPIPRGVTIGSNLTIDFSGASITWGALTATGALVAQTTATVTGILTPTGGINPAGGFANPTVFHSGGIGVEATTGLTQVQFVTTDTYFVEVFIPANTTITGISLLNGHTTSGLMNLMVGLANASGVIVASSTSTNAQAAADAFQQIPFTGTYAAVGPAKYYIAIQASTTTGYFASHAIGNFGATLKTSETFGTFVTTASYSTTTFTTARGPVADTY